MNACFEKEDSTGRLVRNTAVKGECFYHGKKKMNQ